MKKCSCEVFEEGKCTGCNGLEYENINELKQKCETYIEERRRKWKKSGI
jgi:hypothetical protein